MSIKSLSVFFPCVNEEGNLEHTVNKATEVLKKLKLDYEIIIINDGSTDKTGELAEKLAKVDKHLRVIHHSKNLGYGEALKSGFYNAKFDTIVYTDGDRQFDFSEVTKLIDKLDEADLIYGYRIKRRDPFFRLLFAKGWALSLFVFFRLKLRDVDCGFKMVKRKVLEKIPKLESQRGAMINAELAIKTKKAGFEIAEIGVNHYPRLSGKPTGANIRVIIKSFVDLIKLWWKVKQGKQLFILLVLILALAAFLRLYKLSEYMTFLGDEGRDALVIKSILLDHHIPLIGPTTSIGNIYLGPLYYYMMTIPMAIFWLNPVAAAGMNALIGVLTVFVVYYLSKRWFGKETGLIASFLYAVSPVTIIYSRSSWNPNPAPFFSALAIYSFYNANKKGSLGWFVLTGILIGAAAQMHYLALILIPVVGMIWLGETIYRLFISKMKISILGPILTAASFAIAMSPLVWFDFRHNFLNYRAVIELFSTDQAVKVDLFAIFAKAPNIFLNNLITRLIAGDNMLVGMVVGLMVFVSLAIYRSRAVFYLGAWLIVGLLTVSFYQQNIYDHYLGFMNPAPFILLGSIFLLIKKQLKYLFIFFIIALGILNLSKNPLLMPPNNQLERTQTVARYVIEQAGGQDFNFALLAKSNYDSAYQFYFDRFGYPSKQVPFDITKQLFVACEDLVCDPINNQKYEIAAFGWAKIDFKSEVAGVKIFKLVHNPSGKP